jgi:hypothetical protein
MIGNQVKTAMMINKKKIPCGIKNQALWMETSQ